MLIKDARSEEALQMIHRIDQQTQGLPMHYINYLRGEVLLQKVSMLVQLKLLRNLLVPIPALVLRKIRILKLRLTIGC